MEHFKFQSGDDQTSNTLNKIKVIIVQQNFENDVFSELQESPLKYRFNAIKMELRPVVLLLKILAAYPIEIKGVCFRTHNKNWHFDEISYKVGERNWRSVVTWYSYSLLTLMAFAISTYLFNLGFGVPFPILAFGFGPSFSRFGTKILNINVAAIFTNSLVKIVEISLVQWNIGHFVDWLNNWTLYEREFLNCFSSFGFKFKIDICTFRTVMFYFYFLLPSALWILVSIFGIFREYHFYIKYVGHAIYILAALIIWSYALLEDFKVFIMLKTSSLAYEQIYKALKSIKQKINEDENQMPWKLLKAKDVMNWRWLIKLVKKQCAIACRHFKSQQMLLIAEVIESCSMGIFFIISVIALVQQQRMSQESFITFIISATWFCLNSFGRLYCKVLFAENITSKEMKIADEIQEIELHCTDACVKKELKELYTAITQNPTIVNLGNYVNLDKKLLLQVLIHVVTYLIVLMQLGEQ